MAARHSRRDILRGDLNERHAAVMRPPGAQAEFHDLCDDCGACSRACPQRIIRRDPSGGPSLSFHRGGCTFCGDCARACPTGALRDDGAAALPWRARILSGCLSHQGVSCRACEDACEPRAIRFRLQTGGRAEPVLDRDACTGCGECAFACPTDAITFDRFEPARTECPA